MHSTTNRMVIRARHRTRVNTDPQRRCYSGCHFSSELRWASWEALEYVLAEKAEERLRFWRELNDYACSERGESAKREFDLVPEED